MNVLFTYSHITAQVKSFLHSRLEPRYIYSAMMLKFLPGEDGVLVVSLVSSHIRSLTRPKNRPPVDFRVFHVSLGDLRQMFVLYFSLSDEEYKQYFLLPTSCWSQRCLGGYCSKNAHLPSTAAHFNLNPIVTKTKSEPKRPLEL